MTIILMVYRRTHISLSPLIRDNAKFLHVLSSARTTYRRAWAIQIATNEELLAVHEIAINIIKGQIPLRLKQKERIEAQIVSIRKLARARKPNSIRKILLESVNNNQEVLAISILFANILLPFLR